LAYKYSNNSFTDLAADARIEHVDSFYTKKSHCLIDWIFQGGIGSCDDLFLYLLYIKAHKIWL